MTLKKTPSPLNWRAYFTETLGDPRSSAAQHHAHVAAVQLAGQINRIMEQLAAASSSEQATKLVQCLQLQELASAIANADATSSRCDHALLGLIAVMVEVGSAAGGRDGGQDAAVAFCLVLVRHGIDDAALKLHRRIANLEHCASHSVVALLALLWGASAQGDAADSTAMAIKPQLLEVLVSIVMYAATHPTFALSPEGVATSCRALTMLHGMVMCSPPVGPQAAQVLQSIDLASRVLQLLSHLEPSFVEQELRQQQGASPSAAQPAVATPPPPASQSRKQKQAQEEQQQQEAQEASEPELGSDPGRPTPSHLMAAGATLLSHSLGMGAMAASHTASERHRQWLRRAGHVAALGGVVDHLWAALTHTQQADAASSAVKEEEEEDAVVRSSVAAAGLRNLLVQLMVPLIVFQGDGTEAADGVSFVMDYGLLLLQGGWEPRCERMVTTGSAAGGDLAPFFRASGNLLLRMMREYGGLLQAAHCVMEVQDGMEVAQLPPTDAAEAANLQHIMTEGITRSVAPILAARADVLLVLQLAQPRRVQEQRQGGTTSGSPGAAESQGREGKPHGGGHASSTAADASLPGHLDSNSRSNASGASGGSSGGGDAFHSGPRSSDGAYPGTDSSAHALQQQLDSAAAGPGTCELCGKCPSPGQALKTCGGCSVAQYCSRECQVAHHAQHRGVCRSRQALMQLQVERQVAAVQLDGQVAALS